jgi:hypothetical protein
MAMRPIDQFDRTEPQRIKDVLPYDSRYRVHPDWVVANLSEHAHYNYQLILLRLGHPMRIKKRR